MPITYKKFNPLNVLFYLLLGALFLFPVIASVNHYSYYVNNLAAIIQSLIAALLILRSSKLKSFFETKIRPKDLFAPTILFIIAIGWTYQYIPFYGIDRLLVYLSAFIFYVSLSTGIGKSPQLILVFINYKLLFVISLAIFFILFVIFFADKEALLALKVTPPLYRHLRHLNYEMFFGITFSSFYLLSKKRYSETLFALFIFTLLTIWSGARGSALAITIATLIICTKLTKKEAISMISIFTFFVLTSLLLVLWSGYGAILTDTLGYTASDSINRISAGRLTIWQQSIEAVINQGPVAIVTGLGPDAFSRWGLFRNLVQPHNSLVQIFMEFGLIGLIGFMYMAGRITLQAAFLIKSSNNTLLIVLSAAFIGGLLYSLVDGIFYHAYPLTMMIFLAAAINTQALALKRGETVT